MFRSLVRNVTVFEFMHLSAFVSNLIPSLDHGSGQGDRNQLSAAGLNPAEKGAVDGAFSCTRVSGGIRTHFAPPGVVYYEFASKKGGDTNFVLYAIGTPAGRGFTRTVTCFFIVDTPVMFQLLLRFRPRWYEHTLANLILDADLYHLRGQERLMQLHDPDGFGGAWKSSAKGYKFCNGPWDNPVVYFRRWVDLNAANMPWHTPPRLPTATDPIPREQALERYFSHTVNCHSCSTALRRMRVARAIAVAVGVVSLFTMISVCVAFVAVGHMPHGLKKISVLATVMGIISGSTFAFCSKFIPLFFYSNIGFELAHADT